MLSLLLILRIQFFRIRSEQPISTSTNFYFEETVAWERFMEAIFDTPSYVRPKRRAIIGTCSVLKVPQHRDDDESDGGPTHPYQRATSIFRGATSPVAQVQNPKRSTSGRGVRTGSTYTVQRSSNDDRIPSDCGRGVQEESSLHRPVMFLLIRAHLPRSLPIIAL